MSLQKIVLASQSPQRQALMEMLNIPFDIIPAHIDEQAIRESNLKLRAEKIARAKAEHIIKKNPDSIVIAADTYTVFAGRALEKPRTRKEAKEMLAFQSDKIGAAYSGFCYIDPKLGIDYSTTVETKFKFLPLSESYIKHYVKTQPVTTWSAAFSPAYNPGMALIEWVEGSFTSFTHGLPLELLIEKLRQSGVYL